MPIYEYRCESCGFEDEFLQKISDPRLTVCPKCGKSTFSKMISAAGFQLKGSGWYVTDFKDKGAKPAAGKAKSGGEKDAKSASETDAKPAADKEKPAETKKETKSEPVSGT